MTRMKNKCHQIMSFPIPIFLIKFVSLKAIHTQHYQLSIKQDHEKQS